MSQKMTPTLWAQLRYFKADEFDQPEQMEWDLLSRLEKARDAAGIPFVIDRAAFRTVMHNAEIAGAAGNSAHLRGYAVDIEVAAPRNRYLVLYGLQVAGFARIGDRYPGHIHADVDPSLPQNVAW